jgi:hypothetical protein
VVAVSIAERTSGERATPFSFSGNFNVHGSRTQPLSPRFRIGDAVWSQAARCCAPNKGRATGQKLAAAGIFAMRGSTAVLGVDIGMAIWLPDDAAKTSGANGSADPSEGYVECQLRHLHHGSTLEATGRKDRATTARSFWLGLHAVCSSDASPWICFGCWGIRLCGLESALIRPLDLLSPHLVRAGRLLVILGIGWHSAKHS